MCGIFGYSGHKNAGNMVITGLKRLEYRGYDSWGIAQVINEKIEIKKKAGKISEINNLNLPNSTVAIGHTRWATTGAVNDTNAHPHFATDHSFVLAQNGIVENYEELKDTLLKKDYAFISDTDTEVIVRLIEEKYKITDNLLEAVRLTYQQLLGRNTIILLTASSEIIAVRNGSPLVVGIHSKTKEVFFSSDTLSFAPFVDQIVVIDNGQYIHWKNGKLTLFDIKTGNKIPYKLDKLKMTNNVVDKGDFPHFMLKEIHDTPSTLKKVAQQNRVKINQLAKKIKSAHHVYTIGSGTAGVAASQIAFYLRTIAKINATSLVGANASEYLDLFRKNDLLIAPSQSGETADVLEVLEKAKDRGIPIASYVNMPGSAMTRLSDFQFMAGAGPEICVISTKVFISQIAWGYLIASVVTGRTRQAHQNINQLATTIQKLLRNKKFNQQIQKVVTALLPEKNIFLLAKYQNFQIICEGMVKLIEATYKHAHAIPSGDLKHYAITLMADRIPVIVVLSDDETKLEVINAANEVKARGAKIIGISPQSHTLFDLFIQVPNTRDTSAIVNIFTLQLLAYHLGVALGNTIDKPRNIAKSVTVK